MQRKKEMIKKNLKMPLILKINYFQQVKLRTNQDFNFNNKMCKIINFRVEHFL